MEILGLKPTSCFAFRIFKYLLFGPEGLFFSHLILPLKPTSFLIKLAKVLIEISLPEPRLSGEILL